MATTHGHFANTRFLRGLPAGRLVNLIPFCSPSEFFDTTTNRVELSQDREQNSDPIDQHRLNPI
jgi:hypothetical protein